MTEELALSSDAVPAPPWHFWGENIQFEYQIDLSVFQSFLPAPLLLDEASGSLIQVAFSRMSSRADIQTMFTPGLPTDINYRECLVKFRCRLGTKVYWYVPFTWVTSDISLLRGYLQGFPKRIGVVDIARFSTSHPAFPDRKKGESIGAFLSTPDGLLLKADHVAVEAQVSLGEGNAPFILRRRIQDISEAEVALADQFVTPTITFAEDSEIWTGTGSLACASIGSPFAGLFEPVKHVHSRSFVSALTIVGTSVVANAVKT